jgi:oxidase EvaA
VNAIVAESLAGWLAGRRLESALVQRRIALAESRSWRVEHGEIVHRTGGFFSVVGVRVRSDLAALDGVEQPLILQPEIGILGFLLRRPGAGAELLVQAKAEPGNVGEVQLAPTVQATYSNYTRRHGGAPTVCLDYFTGGESSARIVADSLQSEQGTRFLGKYNRNVTVAVAGEGPDPATDAWRWIPAPLLFDQLHEDFAVNTDARSTLVCSDWRALSPEGRPFARWQDRNGFGEALLGSWRAGEVQAEHRGEAVLERLRAMRDEVRIENERRPLGSLRGWSLDADGVRDGCEAGFDVRCFDVSCAGREVERWDQPLVASSREADAVLLVQRRRGVLHLLLRGSPEIGFRERVQFGPTAVAGLPLAGPGDLAAFCFCASDLATRACVRQSDEGGRFHRTVVRYRVLEAAEQDRVPEDPFAVWVTVAQAHALTREQGRLTNEARSLLSLLLRWI